MSPSRKPNDLGSNPEAHLPLTNLAFHILLALGEETLHGYAIIRDIEDRTDGSIKLRSGTLYTAIHRLEDDGLLEECEPRSEDTDPRRKYYRITGMGRRVARLEAARLREMLAVAEERRLTAPGAGQ